MKVEHQGLGFMNGPMGGLYQVTHWPGVARGSETQQEVVGDVHI